MSTLPITARICMARSRIDHPSVPHGPHWNIADRLLKEALERLQAGNHASAEEMLSGARPYIEEAAP